LTVINLISSLAAAIGSIVGGKFADFFAERELSWTLRWVSPGKEIAFQTLNLQQWDFFFLLAFVIGLYSVHRLAMVKEVGEVEERVVFHELVSEIATTTRNLSTAGGLRRMAPFPFLVARAPFKGRR